MKQMNGKKSPLMLIGKPIKSQTKSHRLASKLLLTFPLQFPQVRKETSKKD